MQEFLWEIWTGKRNMHHRIQMGMNETPEAVFRRLIQQLQGTEKEIATRAVDPNTGKEVDLKWRYSCRNKGEEAPIMGQQAFSAQKVQEGALIVVRPIELRANTLYIDGFEGLGQEEIAVASASKRSNLWIAIAAVLLLGAAGYYLFSGGPADDTVSVEIKTEPNGAEFEIIADMTGLPGIGENKINRLSGKTPRRFSLRRAAKIIRISISMNGYQTWSKGLKSQEEWGKLTPDKQKEAAIEPKELTIPGWFPKKLDLKPKEPPKPRAVAVSRPQALNILYPKRKWKPKDKRFRIALDPDHGGEAKGVLGVTTQTPASQLNLTIAQAIKEALEKTLAFKKRVGMTRSKDDAASVEDRVDRAKKRSKLLLQIDLADGIKEFPAGVVKEKVADKEITYNDSIAGYKVIYSEQNKQAEASEKFATCLGTAMKNAGFLPNASAKETLAGSTVGVRKASVPLLDASPIPAVRLVVGYPTHRAEEKVLTNPETHGHLALVVEHALVCYLK